MKLENLLVMAALVAGFALVPNGTAQTSPPPPTPRTLALSTTMTSFLGVGIKEVDSERAKALKLKEEAGVEVTKVEEASPAEKAGLKAGDVIVEYNGQRVEGIEQFSRMVRETPAGRDVKLSVFRNGAPQTIVAKIGAHNGGLPRVVPFEMPDLSVKMPDIPRTHLGWRNSLMGIEAEGLEGQLAEYFGVKEGLLVRSVVKGGAADKAGIKAGDVITKIENANVYSATDMTSHLRSQRGKSVPVVLVRDRKEVTVSLAVPADERSQRRLRRSEDPNWF